VLIAPAFLDDPYPAYRTLREAGPLHFSEAFFGGAWLLTRHEDVGFALRDARLSARRTGGWLNGIEGQTGRSLADLQQIFARALLFLDAPDHGRLRQALMPAFRPAGLQALRTAIAAEAESLLDAIDDSQPFDAVAAFAQPLPARVMARWMGVPDGCRGDVAAWSDDIAAFIGDPKPAAALGQRAQRATLAMAALFRRLLAARSTVPESGGDLLDCLARNRSDGVLASMQDLVAQCAMLLFAGYETTRNLLSNALHALAARPADWERLRQAPDMLPLAVREFLRHDSPVQYSGRRVAAPFVLHGRTFQRGELVIPLIGAANRDPAVFTEPDTLQLDRREAPHLSFGAGPHVCIGAALTTMEAEVALAAVLRRWSALAPAGRAVRAPNAVYRGWAALPLAARE
jgi:cytochrome P450